MRCHETNVYSERTERVGASLGLSPVKPTFFRQTSQRFFFFLLEPSAGDGTAASTESSEPLSAEPEAADGDGDFSGLASDDFCPAGRVTVTRQVTVTVRWVAVTVPWSFWR